MIEWTKLRKCEDCGRNFSLSEYGTENARATAQALGSNSQKYDKNINYIISKKCPACNKEFMVKFIRDEAMRQAEDRKNKKWWQFWK